MNTQDYIQPTKKSPIFIASCNYFGYIEVSGYKMYSVETSDCNSIGCTFATSYKNAVNKLHEWIEENSAMLEVYPKSNFEILLVDGTVDKFDQIIQKSVYSITARKAKKLLF